MSTATASPPAFVPNWDGHTDATVVQYSLVERSIVAVHIVDARGRAVATIDAGLRDAGTFLVSWDGRGSDGAVRAAGAYRVRVDARPRPRPATAGEPGEASMGGGVVVAGSRSATITLQRPPVTLRGVRLTRAAIGRSGRSASTRARFDLPTAASISAAVVDASGRAVRTLATGRMRAGAHALAWDGRGRRGAQVADGDYALVVAAAGSGRPTATTRVPLRVDRSDPTLRSSANVKAVAAPTGLRIPFSLTTSEAATVTVRAGRRSTRVALAGAGTHATSVLASTLGIVPQARSRSIVVTIVAADAAGNTASSTTRVLVPPRVRGAVVRPPAPAPNPSTGASGRLLWPVGGIVTSEFGMRAGRPHTGLDIAVPAGTPIHPSAAGTVTYVGVLGGYGNLVSVEHPGGMVTYYAHMSAFGGFGVGDSVDPLDVIGLVGCTGSCTGPHVHYETRVGVEHVPRDPRAFLVPR